MKCLLLLAAALSSSVHANDYGKEPTFIKPWSPFVAVAVGDTLRLSCLASDATSYHWNFKDGHRRHLGRSVSELTAF